MLSKEDHGRRLGGNTRIVAVEDRDEVEEVIRELWTAKVHNISSQGIM